MPIYDYRCAACEAEFHRLVRGDTKVACPECGGRKLERLMSLPARPGGGGKPAGMGPSAGPGGGGCCGGGCHSHLH